VPDYPDNGRKVHTLNNRSLNNIKSEKSEATAQKRHVLISLKPMMLRSFRWRKWV